MLALVTACGDGDGTRSPDAAPPDAALADATAPDAAVASTWWYVFDSIQVPRTPDDAARAALDLDGDGDGDNKLGALFALIEDQSGFSLGARTTSALATGRLIALASLTTPLVEVGLRRGADLDGDPADNASGEEAFAVVPLTGADGYLYGSIHEGVLTAGPGHAPVQLAFDREVAVLALSALSVRVRWTVAEDGARDGVVAFALTRAMVEGQLLPALADGLNAQVNRDCPSQSSPFCEPDSDGEEILTFFDDDEDGSVSVTELTENSLLAATIGNPDLDLLDLKGEPDPAGDGANDSLSFGFAFTAVPAVLAE